jgi:preprotein translocase subunit SecD
MNPKAKKIFTNVRVIVLLVFLLFAVVAIHPKVDAKGVAIRSVILNSSASIAGIQNPKPTAPPMSREVIVAINNIPIDTIEDYYKFIDKLEVGQVFTVRTNRNNYRVTPRALMETIVLDETVNKTITETITINKTVNGSVVPVNITRRKIVEVPKTEELILGVEDVGLRVYPAPSTNIRKGLELQGGTRVLLQPAEKITKDDMDMLISNMEQRLNVYGLSDVVLRPAGDLSGNQFIVVEIAGANEEEVKELLAKQGKFEAKIGNKTVFKGGKDVTYVCRSADCAGIDPGRGCGQVQGGWACRFRFSISLSPEAAKRQADVTAELSVLTRDELGNVISKENQYLNETLNLFLDDKHVDTLNIGAELKGRAVTDISISGSGLGRTQQEAVYNALENMKRLQTILVTGSLPVKLGIVKTDNISPILGEDFVKNAMFMGLFAIIAVSVVMFIRYRKWQLITPIIVTMLSEVLLLLGMAALIGWNLDLAAIAGIIIAVGTGVDHQILIADETLRKEEEVYTNWKQKIKKAFFIIMGTYLTTMVAMIPLLFAGAGLLKGFALTTMMGVSFGVFVTRPAFAAVIEVLFRE